MRSDELYECFFRILCSVQERRSCNVTRIPFTALMLLVGQRELHLLASEISKVLLGNVD